MAAFGGIVCLACPMILIGLLLLFNVKFAWKLLSGFMAFASGFFGADHTVGTESAVEFKSDSSKVSRIMGLVLLLVGVATAVLFGFLF